MSRGIVRVEWWWASVVCGTAVTAILVSIAAVSVAGIAWNRGTRNTRQVIHSASDVLPTSPYNHVITAAGAPITLTLPNDLSAYVGATHTVYSTTAQPHLLIIESGPLTTTWDGTNRMATLGGAIGDGLTFYVVSATQISFLPPTNVVFS